MALKVQIQTIEDLNKLEEGDLIEFERPLYSHWAVYVGGASVMHLTGIAGVRAQSSPHHIFTISGQLYSKAAVTSDDFWTVAEDTSAYKNNTADAKFVVRRKEDIVEIAVSHLGVVGYNLMTKNCEHFAKHCRYNKWHSDQVNGMIVAVVSGIIVGLILSRWLF